MDPEVLINLLVEMAGLEEELEALRAARRNRARRANVIRLGEEAAREVTAESAAARRADSSKQRIRLGRLNDLETALADRRDKLIGVVDRRQYRALQTEIRGLEAEIDRLETDALEYLEGEARNRSEVEPPAPSAAMASPDEQAAEKVADRQADLAEPEINAELDRLTGLVPEPDQGHLRRLRQRGRAVVRLQERSCGGCGGQLPRQQALDAGRGRAVVRCPSCAAFVVRLSYS